MSRKQYDLTVNTGGEMGQILDHLVCASDRSIRLQDGRAALKLHAALRAENERLREAIEREAFWLESQRFDGTSPETFVVRAASLRAAAEKKEGERA